MRKRRTSDGLDLFLDAICNMFGGFLFIMLFVVVSIRSATTAGVEKLERTDVRPVSDAELDVLRTDIEKLERDIAELGEDRAESRAFALKLVDPENVEKVKETSEVLEEVEKIKVANAETERENQETREEAEKLEEEKERLEKELTQAKEETEDAEEELEKVRAKRTRKTAPPMLKLSFKTEIPIVLKYGRVYFWHTYSAYGTRASDFNEDEFVVVKTKLGGSIQTEPKPYRGIDLNGDDVELELSRAFSRFDPSRDYFTIVVSDDSFGDYNILSSFLKRKNFDINPWTNVAGGVVVDRGGSGHSAQ